MTSRLANIYDAGNGSLHIEINAGYGDYIELRTGDDLLELLRDLITAGNAHFGTTARLIEASGELNVGEQDSLGHFSVHVGGREFVADEFRTLSFEIDGKSGAIGALVIGDGMQTSTGTVVHPSSSIGTTPGESYTWADFRREHLAQFEAMVDAIKVGDQIEIR